MRFPMTAVSVLAMASGMFLGAGVAQAQPTRYVNDDNCPGPGSGTEADPFCLIQDCIDAVMNGQECVAAPGTYFETINFLGKAITLRSTDPSDPAVVAATIIDAADNGTVVTCDSDEGPDTVLDGFTITGGTGTDSGDGILQGGGMYNLNSSPTVTNCTFSGNTADFGGGMSTLSGGSGSPTVSNCTFSNNSAAEAGGGLATSHGSPTVSDCTFSNNSAVEGGGMRVFKGAPTIRNCLFDLNQSAEDGGGLFSESADTVVEGCVFSNNVAGEEGGGARMIVGFFGGEFVTFTGCIFANNTSVKDGGGLYLQGATVLLRCDFVDNISTMNRGGGLHCILSEPILVSDCNFTGNAAPQHHGGGAFIKGLPATIERCTFSNNTAEFAGGIYLGGVATMTDCLIERNISETLGGGVQATADFGIIRRCIIRGNRANRGGGIYMSHSDDTSISDSLIVGNSAIGKFARGGGVNIENIIERRHLTNCTLFGNVATTEGDGIHIGNSATTTIDNCILWNNSISGNATVRYSDVQGGWQGEGNIAADPLFVDADGPDDILGNEDDNLRLQPGSPCIDAGDNTAVADGVMTDLDGNPRFADDPDTPDTGNPDAIHPIVDMGAYEVHGAELAPALDMKPGSCPNPLNRHGNGVLPVALVGTGEFDPTEVDLSTLQLSRADGVGGSVGPNEGPPGPHSVFEDVASAFEGEACECHDLGGDGIDDLSMKFRTEGLVEALELDALPGGSVVELVLSGSLLDGTPFAARDCIVILPTGDTSPANAQVQSNVADTFVEVGPLDLNFDDDGFADFLRSYYSGTAMTLTAPVQSQGRRFVRWLVDGVPQPIGIRTIEVIVSEETTLKAAYARPARATPEHPTESDDPLE